MKWWIIFLFPIVAGAVTTNSPTSGFDDVQLYLNYCKPGDTLQVPASNPVTWNGTLVLTRGIFLKGPGRDSLTIKNNNCSVSIQPNSTAVNNGEEIRVEGFTFNGNGVLSGGGTGIMVVDSVDSTVTKPYTNLVIGKNRFSYTGTAAIALLTKGQNRGVIYSNIFDRCDVIFKGLGRNANDLSEWDSGNFTRSYGSRDNLYFECNTILYTSSYTANEPGWVEMGQGGRACVRYNTWDLNNAVMADGYPTHIQIHDSHGFQGWPGGDGQPGTMITEFYGNTISNSPGQTISISRGGWAMFHNNVFGGTGYNYLDINQYDQSRGDNGQCNSGVPGLTTDGQITNTYYFNNTDGNGVNKDAGPDNAHLGACGIAANVNYYTFTSPFDGSAGVGRGTTPPTPSVVGVAYWSNNVASTVLPTTDPAKIQACKLYISYSGSSWDSVYTPFTFPHPLSGSGDSSPTVPRISDGPHATTNWSGSQLSLSVKAN